MTDHSRAVSPFRPAWPLAMATAAVLGTLATACMMPFVGLAVIAAATMTRAQALVTVTGIWAANQLLGFGLLGYPLDSYALVWGLALGGASMAAMLVARAVLNGDGVVSSRIVMAFAAAFVGYEALLFGFALIAGGTGTFTAPIIAQLLVNDAAWALALAGLHFALARTAPGLFATPVPAR